MAFHEHPGIQHPPGRPREAAGAAPGEVGVLQFSTSCFFCYQDGHSLANEKHHSGPNMTLRFI